ncbi:MAG TPA: nitrite/sulfite reductase [Candidatus Acidoferrales bacterium]|nr:nitrite/sulfite reductase [Candidatus Acidoferrales bacterium]
MPSELEATTPKENSAQRTERLKHAKNPWEALEEIREFARLGRDSVPPEWSLYFRWWGIYTQGDGVGAVGGKGGEGKASPYFMVRVALPNGLLRADRLRAIADLADRHCRGVADITVRQNMQLHWVSIESLPALIEGLEAAGLSTRGACGDVVRNITGCPLAGVAADEIYDASPLVLEVERAVRARAEFYNLPRKFKICLTGCPVWCSYPEINDIALTAVVRTVGGRREAGFSVRVGGGLATEPHLAVRLNAFVRPEHAVRVTTAITEIFRDEDALRENRKKARMKYLFMHFGWTAESFLQELNRRLGFELDPAADEVPPADVFRDHAGIHAQKQDGLCYVGASVLRGRITPAQMRVAAGLSERYGSGELRATGMQNLVLVNIPGAKAETVARELDAAGLPISGSSFWRGAIACTGTEFCKLAITEVKGYTRWLVDELEERVPGFDQQLKLNVTGCTNSCAQHWIADIGLEGKKIKHEGKMVDAYYFSLGGAVGEYQRLARPVGYRCPATEVPDAITRLLQTYLANRSRNENLREYFARFSDEELRAQLAGTSAAPGTRDLAPGPVPVSVGD